MLRRTSFSMVARKVAAPSTPAIFRHSLCQVRAPMVERVQAEVSAQGVRERSYTKPTPNLTARVPKFIRVPSLYRAPL